MYTMIYRFEDEVKIKLFLSKDYLLEFLRNNTEAFSDMKFLKQSDPTIDKGFKKGPGRNGSFLVDLEEWPEKTALIMGHDQAKIVAPEPKLVVTEYTIK